MGAVFIQNGCPEAEISNTYLKPRVKTMVGFGWLLIIYSPVPELVTVYLIEFIVDNDGVTILKFKGSVVVKDEYLSRPFDTRTPLMVVSANFVP